MNFSSLMSIYTSIPPASPIQRSIMVSEIEEVQVQLQVDVLNIQIQLCALQNTLSALQPDTFSPHSLDIISIPVRASTC